MKKISNYSKMNNIEYIDLLRILATIAVIIIHVAAQDWYIIDVKSFDWQVMNFYDGLFRWAVPIFVMISGALFLRKDYDLKTIYFKKILRIVVAFIFWSIIYAVSKMAGGGLLTFLLQFVTGEYHMWFLFMIVGLYIAAPLLKKITESEMLMKYFLIISFVFSVIIPHSLRILSLLNHASLNLIINAVNTDLIYLSLTFGYTGYFVLGYYLSTVEISNKIQKLIFTFGILGFISTIVLTSLGSKHLGFGIDVFYNYFSINVALESIFMFVFAKKYFKSNKVLKYFSNISFGIYLVHVLIQNELYLKFGVHTLSFNPIISIPLITVFIFLVGTVISSIIHKIPVLKKYIV